MYKIFLLLISALLFGNTQTLEHIKLQLKWKNQFQFAGYYVAKEKGFYKQDGLDVDIVEYNNSINIVESVEKPDNGGVYGVGYPSVILRKANGHDIVLLNAINQLSPHVLLSLHSSGIHSIRDFKHKKIMIGKEEVTTASFIAMVNSHQISIKDMILLQPSFDINSLLNGDTDITTAYLSNETYQLNKLGVKYDVWNPANYGFDFYDDILFTSENELKKHPKRVEAFQQASLKGWRYAYTHIDETINLILKKYNTQHKTKDALKFEAQELKKLSYINDIPFGDINIEKVKRIVDIYNILGLVHQNTDIDTFIYHSPKKYKFSKDEINYLKNKQSLKLCTTTNLLPFENYMNDKYVGMNADYFKLIQNKYNIKIETVPTKDKEQSLKFIKSKKCDMISLITYSKEDSKYLDFTTPYFQPPLVVATKKGTQFIADIHTLSNKKIVTGKHMQLKSTIKKYYPYLDITEVKSIKDGLSGVQTDKYYAYIDTLPIISYALQRNYAEELKISGKLENTIDLHIAVRKDDKLLFSIMSKAVNSIDNIQKRRIFNNWVYVKYINKIQYDKFFEVVIFATTILVVVILLYRRENRLKKELEIQNRIFDITINTIESPMFYKNKNGIYQNANKAFTKSIFAVEPQDIIGKSLDDLEIYISKDEINFYKNQDEKLYASKKNQVYETKIRLKNGQLRDYKIQKIISFSEKGDITGYVGFMYDITDIKEKEKMLEFIASTDPMTKLYNRRYFTKMSETILKIAKREKHPISILMFDIDDFKKVNDTYGHKVGDDVIISIANILKQASRDSDVPCRFGGEEFILLLPDTSLHGAEVIAKKIRKSIKDITIHITDTKSINITVSIGVSSVDIQTSSNIELAIKHSDDALYKAKANGKDRIEIYENTI